MNEVEKMTRVRCNADYCEFNNKGECGLDELEIDDGGLAPCCHCFTLRGGHTDI